MRSGKAVGMGVKNVPEVNPAPGGGFESGGDREPSGAL